MNECKAWAGAGVEAIPFLSSPLASSGDVLNCVAAGPSVSTHISSAPKSGPRVPFSRISHDAEKICKWFNSRAFRREQPSDPQLMLEIVAEAVAAQDPIPFVLYWGKGPRSAIDRPDIECLDFLAAFARRVREAHAPGATIKLIFTDTHAQLNGHAAADSRSYFGDIEAGALKRGFDTCRLSDLLRAAEAVVGPLEHREMPKELEARLSASAKKWYRGGGTAEDGARKYFQINMMELRAVELAFPRTIFITYNSPDYRILCPARLPVFYMYTLQRGYRIKPWFLPAPQPVSG
jgi:L-tyrosine isonitrile synthase